MKSEEIRIKLKNKSSKVQAVTFMNSLIDKVLWYTMYDNEILPEVKRAISLLNKYPSMMDGEYLHGELNNALKNLEDEDFIQKQSYTAYLKFGVSKDDESKDEKCNLLIESCFNVIESIINLIKYVVEDDTDYQELYIIESFDFALSAEANYHKSIAALDSQEEMAEKAVRDFLVDIK